MDIQLYQPQQWDIDFNQHDETKIDKDLLVLENILGDQKRYLQILQNFLSNALKFTQQNGKIHIRISLLEKQNQNSEVQQNYLKKKISQRQLNEYINQNQISKDPFQQNKKLKKSQTISSCPDDTKKQQQFKDFFCEYDSNQKFIKIQIEIIDSGVGIKKENLSKLFMDFGRLDEHSKMNASGTGLGLSICKRMIEQMGGTVKVNSIEGQGTTFTINLSMQAKILSEKEKELQFQENYNDQLKIQNNNNNILINNLQVHNQQHKNKKKLSRTSTFDEFKLPQDQEAKVSIKNFPNIYILQKIRCVIANDDQFQLMAVSNTLENLGIEVIKECMNGLQAFEFVLMNQELKIDFILLDLDMPIMNGYEACQKICHIYDNDNKIFGSSKSQSAINQVKRNKIDYKLDKKFLSVYEMIQEIDMIPLMIAFSAFVDQSVIQSANQNGFEIVIESPLTVQIIQDEILQRLEIRNIKQDEKFIIQDSIIGNKMESQQINRYKERLQSNSMRKDYLTIFKELSHQQKYYELNFPNSSKDNQIEVQSIQDSIYKNQNETPNRNMRKFKKSVSFQNLDENSKSSEEEQKKDNFIQDLIKQIQEEQI